MPVQPVLYEAMYILDNALDEAGVTTAVEALEEVIRSGGGEVIATREFGKRRLAYEIDGHTSGTYMILYFKSLGPQVQALPHEMRLIEGIVRGIVCVANPKAIFDPKAAEAPAEPVEAEAVAEVEAEDVTEIAGELGPEAEAPAAEEVAEEAEALAVEEVAAEEAEAPAAEEVAAEAAEVTAAEEVAEEEPAEAEAVAEVEETAAAEAPAPEEA